VGHENGKIWNNSHKRLKKWFSSFVLEIIKVNNTPLKVQKNSNLKFWKYCQRRLFLYCIPGIVCGGFCRTLCNISMRIKAIFFLDSSLAQQHFSSWRQELKKNCFDSHRESIAAKPPRTIPGMHTQERTPSYRHCFPNLRF